MKKKTKIPSIILCVMIVTAVFSFFPQAKAEQITFGSIQELTPTDEDVLFSAWSPDGKKIAYVKRDAVENDVWNIWVKEVDSADAPIQITQSVDNVNYLTALTWSPDGTRVIFDRHNSSIGRQEIAATDANGSLVVSNILSDPTKHYSDPDISRLPTDNRLVYRVNWWNLYSIEVADNAEPISGTEVQLTSFSAQFPKWSYSTDKITFVSMVSDTDCDVYVLNEVKDIINGTSLPPASLEDPRVITIIDNNNSAAPSGFSFDERLVYYFEDVNGVLDLGIFSPSTSSSDWVEGCDFDLFSMNADGSGSPQKIYDQPYNQGYMVASPDGTWVSFITDQQPPDLDIYIASFLVSENVTSEGGTVVDGSGTTVDIPAGALAENETITIETPPLDNIPPSTIPLVTARDFGPDGLTFNEPVTITIHYTDASVEGYDEESLQIYYYNESTESWEPLGGTVDTEANTITVEVTHFSIFAVMLGVRAQLNVASLPVAGIPFTIDGELHYTPYTEMLSEGSRTLEMPQTHNGYIWSHWLEDGDPNRIKTVTMDTNITLTGVFTYVPPPTPVGGKALPINKIAIKLELQTPWIWLLTILLAVAVMTVGYAKKRKRPTEIIS